MFFVPSVLRALLDAAPHAHMGTVRLVTFGGEALYGRDTRRARALFGPETVFRNRLSSTETHGMAGRVVTAADDEHATRSSPWARSSRGWRLASSTTTGTTSAPVTSVGSW